jgi:predicted CoA-binding protein
MAVHTRQTIDNFLAQKRIAFAGVSRNPADFSRVLFAELVARGYDVVPVNPHASEIESRTCYSTVSAIQPGVDGALLMTGADEVDPVVEDCAAAGVRHIWLYRAAGRGAVTPTAVAFCQRNGIEVVAGECPFMFLPHTQWFHRLHGAFNKITGTYPAAIAR